MQYYTDFRIRRNRRFNPATAQILKILFYFLLGFTLITFFVVIWFSRDLPAPGKLANPELKSSTRILDKNGTLLYSFYKDYNRVYVPLSEIPKTLVQATIVAEDENFYKNQGFSIRGYLRAFRDLVFSGRMTGGSTITQQLVKNVLLTPERSFTRKIKELILAIQVDRRYTKDEILEMYLNDVAYGGPAVGVAAAANLYFNKNVGDLDLAESAFLAGLTQAPSYYSPFTKRNKAYINRTDYVLSRLVSNGYISQKEREKALDEIKNYKFSEPVGSIKAPHFTMYVKQELISMFGENMVEAGNLTVKTTLDYKIEKQAEEIIKKEVEGLKVYKASNAAAVVLDPKTGAILAMVGSADYFDVKNEGNFNAALARRQPGSSLKPIMYAVAFEKGYTPATLVMDTKTDFPTDDPSHPIYTPVNYDGKYRGPIQIRFALGNSINIPAVKMLARVGIKPVMQKAYEMGIKNWQPTEQNLQNVGLSLVLGGREASLLEIVSSYSVFATGGIKNEPYAIEEVRDSKGNILYKHQKVSGQRVLSEAVSFLISHILLDNNARKMVFGENSWLVVPGKTVSVKTGTTDQKRDNWTIGYTPSYVVGVWVGNNDNSPMNPAIASGVTGAAPAWNKIMSFVLKGKSDEPPKKPDNVVAVEIDAFGGGLPVSGQPTRSEYFIKGTEPTTPSPIYKRIKISKHDTDKLANTDEIEHGDYETKEYIVFSEDDPVSKDGKNRWQEGIDAWIRENHSAADWQYYPPKDTSGFRYPKESSSPTPTVSLTPTPSGPSPSPTGQ